ncbi:hypothetical protein [Clostridium sporogenes]|uniref:hypothetical protein n=1 Tax=Clostridium sporogenes TaxID=1509 RepID=UPI0013CF57BD|nr:hypothetical protein [Clostridium sporogenes]NFH40808.1 hypothetical protein [Clostridium sporogenes]
MTKCEKINICKTDKKHIFCKYCIHNESKVKIDNYYNYDAEALAFKNILKTAKDLNITEEQIRCAIDMVTECCENDNNDLTNIK